MSSTFENPFSGYGNIVTGDRFIGRRDGLRAIDNRVARPMEPGNLAIVGLPRAGKSSLAHNAIMAKKADFLARGVLPIWVNLAIHSDPTSFFRALVELCAIQLQELDWLDPATKNASEAALEPGATFTRIQRFFEMVRASGRRVLFVIDEFDHARHLFKGDFAGFQALRELSYQPSNRVTVVTTCRRSIRDIEIQTKAISTLDGIFRTYYLANFDEIDLDQYFVRLEESGVAVGPELRARVGFYCGAHPYLLEVLGYEIVEISRGSREPEVDRAATSARHAFVSYYDQLASLLEEDGTLDVLLKVLFGPSIDIKPDDVDGLLRYGLIKGTDLEEYEAFSGQFQAFLGFLHRNAGLWPLWCDTEKGIRSLIVRVMVEVYGESWLAKLEKSHVRLSLHKDGRNLFQRCRDLQAREQAVYGERASPNPLDFAYPQELFDIMFAEWEAFRPVFGKDKAYWAQRAQLLSRVRTPLAHNRETAILDHERRIAEGYCGEILYLINGT